VRILAIGAHADDVELGCGGSLLLWGKRGHDLSLYIATDSAYRDPAGREIRAAAGAAAEAAQSAAILRADLRIGNLAALHLAFGEALNAALVDEIDRVRPDLVLTHWPEDSHVDHAALGLATIHACRRVPRILTYRSNWYVAAGQFDPRFYVDISTEIEEKLNLVAVYASETARTSGVWLDWCRNDARARGYAVGVEYAEGFGVIKWLASLPSGALDL
jgi:N-acetylglucosamine malate deacetylase 1